MTTTATVQAPHRSIVAYYHSAPEWDRRICTTCLPPPATPNRWLDAIYSTDRYGRRVYCELCGRELPVRYTDEEPTQRHGHPGH